MNEKKSTVQLNIAFRVSLQCILFNQLNATFRVRCIRELIEESKMCDAMRFKQSFQIVMERFGIARDVKNMLESLQKLKSKPVGNVVLKENGPRRYWYPNLHEEDLQIW